jgi:hypothetical protein
MAELTENGIIALNDLQEDLGRQVLDILRSQDHTPQMGGVMNNVVNQSQETIDKVIPGSRLMGKTPL